MIPLDGTARRRIGLAAVRQTRQIDAEQTGPLGGAPCDQHVGAAQPRDIGRPQQGHERAHVVAPCVQLSAQGLGALLDQGAQYVPGSADGAGAQGQ